VVAAAALSVPRVLAKLTDVPSATGAPLDVQLTVTGIFGVQGVVGVAVVAMGISTFAAGAVN
jgi:hypothetical protein